MKDIKTIISILNKKIKNSFADFSGVYLYGSYVNGSNTDKSDIDIVALFNNPLSRIERMRLWTLISDIEGEYSVILDLHPMAEDELKKNAIYYNQVVNKGIFYGA